MRAKCFDITRRAVDAIAQHQPALIRCDALSTASLHHYLYKCRVLAAQKKWRSARNGAANVLHARLRRDGSSVVSVALEPTACSSARLELPPEVVSGSVLVASAQFVGARRLDVAAPRFEARPSRRRRRKDEELLGAFGPATWTLPQSRCRRWSCRSDGAYVITRLLLTQDRRAYSSKMPSRHFNKWAIEQGPKARPSKPR